MSESPYTFAYADLSHAIKAGELAVTCARQVTTDAGDPVFVLGFRGDCVCDTEPAVEVSVLITDLMLVDLIAELIATAFEKGVAVDRLAELVGRAGAHKSDVREGQLYEACDHCGRAEPECICNQRWALR